MRIKTKKYVPKIMVIVCLTTIFGLIFILNNVRIDNNIRNNLSSDLLPFSSFEGEEITFFEDNFSTQNDYWHWIAEDQALYELGDGNANFTILNTSTTSAHSIAGISNNTENEYFEHQAHFKIKNSGLDNGSRGWGFWNGEMGDNNSSIASFIYMESSEDYPNKGFYAVVQSNGTSPIYYNISEYIPAMQEWNNYTIDWNLHYCAFFINNSLIWNATENLPNLNSTINIWIDNRVFDQSNNQILHTLQNDGSLFIDHLAITKGWTPPDNDNADDGNNGGCPVCGGGKYEPNSKNEEGQIDGFSLWTIFPISIFSCICNRRLRKSIFCDANETRYAD